MLNRKRKQQELENLLNQTNKSDKVSDKTKNKKPQSQLSFLVSHKYNPASERDYGVKHNVNYDYIKNKYFELDDELELKIPADTANILATPQDCLNTLEAIAPLSKILLNLEFLMRKDNIYRSYNLYKEIKDNVAKDQISLNIKLESLYLITKTARLANEFLIKSQFTLEEFKTLVKSTFKDDELSLTGEPINLKEISQTLEGITRIFPEIIFPSKQRPVIEPRLFTDSNLAKTSTSLVTDTVYSFCVSRSISFEKITEKLHRTSKSFKSGTIDLLLQKAEETIVKEYGEETFKVFISLVSYWYEKSDLLGTITVSGSDILDYLNKKYERANGKRISKKFNLQWLAHQCELIDGLKVYSAGISPNIKGKKEFMIERTYLIEFPKISYVPYQLDLEGKADLSSLTDVHLTFKVGEWFQYFNSASHYEQFGFIHEKALSSHGMLSNFLQWINFKTKQNQKGNFKIKTVLEAIGERDNLEKILTNKGSGYKAKDLFNRFNAMLQEAQSIEGLPQVIAYDPPQWENRKPKGWFNNWLNTIINIRDREAIIRAIEAEKIKPSAPKTRLTGEDLKSALEQYKDNRNVSLRKIATHYGTSQPTLSRKIKANNLSQQELKDLINVCHFLGKNKK